MKSLSLFAIAGLLAASVAVNRAAAADDIEGAWATDGDNCAKVFTSQSGAPALALDSDLYGGGFVIEGDRITGKMARCTIKKRQRDGDMLHLLTACATDIMYSNIQFSLRMRPDGRITRVFPGMAGMEITYSRCK
jgi:hypothetical protein